MGQPGISPPPRIPFNLGPTVVRRLSEQLTADLRGPQPNGVENLLASLTLFATRGTRLVPGGCVCHCPLEFSQQFR